ncbi:MAG: hypothetical protein ACTSRS_05505 [Candidatus Helarchaeota archaeon]
MEVFTGKKPFIELKREDLMKIKNQEAFIPIIYSEIVSLLIGRYGQEYAMKRMKEMGYKLAEGLIKYWIPKKIDSIEHIIKETYKFFLYRNIEIKQVLDKIYVRDKECPVCYLDITDAEIPFCIVISGMIERLINLLREKNPKLPLITCENISSRSMGKDICIHVISAQ